MRTNRGKRSGFTRIWKLVGIGVIGLSLGAAWMGLSATHHAPVSHAAYAVQSVSSITPASSTAVVETPVVVTQQTVGTISQSVEKVPEISSQLTVPNSIKDLTYQTSTVTLKNGKVATLTTFSTSSLTQLDSNCSASVGPLGSIEKVDGQYPTSDPYAALDYGNLLKQFSTYYLAGGKPQASCTANTSAQAAAGSDRADFVAAEPSIVQAN